MSWSRPRESEQAPSVVSMATRQHELSDMYHHYGMYNTYVNI